MAERELHPAYRLSGLARPVDPAYPTNKAVLVLLPAVFVLAVLWRALAGGLGWGEAALAGGHAVLLSFFAWALTRELSPDDNPAAFLAVALALAAWSRVGSQSIWVLAATLLAARLVNRCTGKPAHLSDSLIAVAAFAALAWWQAWSFALLGAVALALDAWLPARSERRLHRLLGPALAAWAVALVLLGRGPKLALPPHAEVLAGVVALYGLAVLLQPRPQACGDVDGQPLSRLRVRAGMAMGLLAALLFSTDASFDLVGVGALWACLLAVGLGMIVLRLRSRLATSR